MTKNSIITWSIVGLIVVGGIGLISYANSRPGELDGFAQCLKDSGTIFYGAFWCPQCQTQKSLFGRSARLLPYYECSTPDGGGQIAACQEKNITGYPTWVFPDGSREVSRLTLETLAEKSGCQLPE